MPIYRLYMITAKDNRGVEVDACYIGCTRSPLHKRFHEHKRTSNCSSRKLLDQYGMENCHIRLLRLIECDPAQAKIEERRLIEEHHGRAVNARLPGRDAHERYLNKRDELLPQLKEYYKENRDEIKRRCLQRYYDKRAQILEHVKRTVECAGCGKSMKYSSLSLHRKKHCMATPSSHTTSEPLPTNDPSSQPYPLTP